MDWRGEKVEAGSSVGGCCIARRGRQLEQVGSRQDMLMDWEGAGRGKLIWSEHSL